MEPQGGFARLIFKLRQEGPAWILRRLQSELTLPTTKPGKIMHAALQLGEQTLMASDSPPAFQKPMSGFAVSVDLATPADVERAFAALSKGGTVTMPVGETFFAKSFSMLTDRFGTPWMIICPKEM